MRSSTPLCFLAVCLLGPALAFVSPSGGIVASHARRSAPSSCTSRTRTISPLVMQAGGPTAEAAVERYKKYVGPARWSSEEGMAEKAAGVFEEISSVYGEENAAEMVKAVPGSLGFDPSLFRETFEAFTEVFGAEETKGMVTRNPNLLAVRPTGFGGAINAKKDTMQMSYLIAYTRPLGPVLLASLFLLLSIPFVEQVTGIPREQFLSVLSKGSG